MLNVERTTSLPVPCRRGLIVFLVVAQPCISVWTNLLVGEYAESALYGRVFIALCVAFSHDRSGTVTLHNALPAYCVVKPHQPASVNTRLRYFDLPDLYRALGNVSA